MTSPLVKKRLIPLAVVFCSPDRLCRLRRAGRPRGGAPCRRRRHTARRPQPPPPRRISPRSKIISCSITATNPPNAAQRRACRGKSAPPSPPAAPPRTAPKNLHFHLLTAPNAINAFALPSGDIYVTTALVNRMHNEGELAAVLAGQVAHVISGHVMVSSTALNAPPPAKPLLHFSIEQESAADLQGLKLMADAGYSPESMLSMFRVLTEAYITAAPTRNSSPPTPAPTGASPTSKTASRRSTRTASPRY